MSATNSTTNYNLPVFIGTDKPAWLTDWNGAMNTIDSTIASVSNAQQGDATSISGLQSSVSSLSDTVSGHTTAITSLNSAVSGNTGSINTINSLIGNGEPTTTDKTIIGAINELNAEIVPVQELTASNVPIAPILGLTADDVQEALEELVGGASEPTFDDFGVAVDLTAYTESSPYVTPSSGYISLYCQAENGRFATGVIHGTSADVRIRVVGVTSTQANYSSLYIEKGMSIYGIVDAGTGANPSTVTFVPIINA